ncbi:hypothetical protein CCACVL1_19665, partial [Corchorus capsularis]
VLLVIANSSLPPLFFNQNELRYSGATKEQRRRCKVREFES